MKTSILVFLVLSSSFTFLSILFRIKPLSKFKRYVDIAKDLTYILSVITIVFTYAGDISVSKLLYILFLSVPVLFVSAIEFIKSTIQKEPGNTFVAILEMVLYGFVIAGLKVYHGFNFVELIAFSASAIVFYLSTYFLKRDGSTKDLVLFFIYTTIISYAFGSSLTPIIIGSSLKDGVIITLFIGMAFLFIFKMFDMGDRIFKKSFSKSKALLQAVEIGCDLGVMMILSSILLLH